MFENIADYFTNETDLWSMSDLVSVKNGILIKFAQLLIKEGEEHILNCEVC